MRKSQKENAVISEKILLPFLFSSLIFTGPHAHIWSFFVLIFQLDIFFRDFSVTFRPDLSDPSPARTRTPCPSRPQSLEVDRLLLSTVECFKEEERVHEEHSTSVNQSHWVGTLQKLTSK